MQKQRYSRQREAVLLNLQGRRDHPSADMVYESLRQDWPNISLGTVYRNLNTLSADGSIVSFTVGGKERFDGNTVPHIHFVCTRCGTIQDVYHPSVEEFLGEMSELLHCTVSSAHIVMNGKCSVCQE